MSPRARAALLVPSIAQMMVLLDATIMNIALPDIRSDLGFSGPGLSWVVSAYALAFGGLLLLGGRLGDRLGHRRVFVGGLVAFTLASLLGGLAPGPGWLVAARVAQGVGAAALSPAVLALIMTTFNEPAERARAIGTYTIIATCGGGVGLVLGGIITTTLSWRWVMIVNVPLGVVLAVAALALLPTAPPAATALDVPGAAAGTTSATLLVLGLVLAAPGGSHVGWEVPALIVIAGLLAGTGFVMAERRHSQPLVPLGLFADRFRAGAYVLLATTSASMVATFFFLTLQLQQIWGWSTLETAAVYLPSTAVTVIAADAGGRLLTRGSVRTIVVGGLLAAGGGMAWLAAGPVASGERWLLDLLAPSLLLYAGLGVVAVPLTASAVAGVSPSDVGAVSGVVSTLRQLGGAAGLAAVGLVVWFVAAGSSLPVGIHAGLYAGSALLLLSLAPAMLLVPAQDRKRQPEHELG